MTASTSIQVRIARRTIEAADICGLELVAADGGALPAFSAGSHIDLFLPNGIVRQYSLCNAPSESHRYQIAVLRDPASRGGSAAVHERLQTGDLITISAPRNHFALSSHAPSHLLMAGGIGITPILCMAERLSALNADFTLHYACRTPERTAFRQRITTSPFAGRTNFYLDQQHPLDIGHVLGSAAANAHLYVCGPQGFMDAVLGAARKQDWAENRLHWEFFAAAQPLHQTGDGAFEVQLASSGRVITIGPDKTITQALADEGVDVMVSCEQGVCGTCLTRVLEGEIDHRDTYLTPEEQALNDPFTPCCSRSHSARLVLDL